MSTQADEKLTAAASYLDALSLMVGAGIIPEKDVGKILTIVRKLHEECVEILHPTPEEK